MTKDELIKKAKLLINKEAAEFYDEIEQQSVDYVITWAADFALEQIAAERRKLFELFQNPYDGIGCFSDSHIVIAFRERFREEFAKEFAQEFADELAEVKDGR